MKYISLMVRKVIICGMWRAHVEFTIVYLLLSVSSYKCVRSSGGGRHKMLLLIEVVGSFSLLLCRLLSVQYFLRYLYSLYVDCK
jgi:hypothetical protein